MQTGRVRSENETDSSVARFPQAVDVPSVVTVNPASEAESAQVTLEVQPPVESVTNMSDEDVSPCCRGHKDSAPSHEETSAAEKTNVFDEAIESLQDDASARSALPQRASLDRIATFATVGLGYFASYQLIRNRDPQEIARRRVEENQ